MSGGAIASPSKRSGSVPLPGYRGLLCRPLDDELAPLLVACTLDERDPTLREMTHDMNRFSSLRQLARWRRRREALCLVDGAGALLGIVWVAEKPIPERSDYHDSELIRERGPHLTFAIRLYRPVRGRGVATAFAEYALTRLLDGHSSRSLWFKTRADNASARQLGKHLGFSEVSGEDDGTVVGVRFADG